MHRFLPAALTLALLASTAFASTAEAAPDLRVTKLQVTGSTTGLTAQVTVKNVGTSSAGGFYIDAFKNPSFLPVEGDYGDTYKYVSALGTGQSTTLSFSFSGWLAGTSTSTIYVLLDTDGYQSEVSEDNNRLGAVLSPGVTYPSPFPDFTLDLSNFTPCFSCTVPVGDDCHRTLVPRPNLGPGYRFDVPPELVNSMAEAGYDMEWVCSGPDNPLLP